MRDGSILVADANGSGERVVVSGAMDPDWSPDGTELVFARTANPGLGVVGVDGGGFGPYDRQRSEPRLVTRWASDRLRPLHQRARQLSARRLADSGGRARRDRKRVRTEDGDETDDTAPAWGPGSQLAFARSRRWQDAGDSHVFTLSGRLTTAARTPVEVRTPAGKTLRGGRRAVLRSSSR